MQHAEDFLDSQGFYHVGCLFLEKDADGEPILDNPQEKLSPSELHKRLEPPFCRLRLPKLPQEAGVYAIVVAEQVVYVGKTAKSLAARWSGYRRIGASACKANGGQVTNARINHRLLESHKEGHVAHLWFREVPDVEKIIMTHFSPAWN